MIYFSFFLFGFALYRIFGFNTILWLSLIFFVSKILFRILLIQIYYVSLFLDEYMDIFMY